MTVREIASRSRGTTPDLSVAFSTYQRASLLPDLFTALEAQTLDPDRFEVVVTDNGSTDGTEAVLKEIVERTSLSVRALRVEVNRGPAVGRNAAWRGTTAPIVAFTDDDCVPRPEWLEHGLAAMQRQIAIVVGRTVPEMPFSEMGPFARTMNVHDVEYLATCNIFYRRDDLEALGGFDEVYETPTGEDTDLAWRARDTLNRAFAFEGDAVVQHAVRPSEFTGALRETARWYGIPLFVARHPSARQTILYRRIFWKASHPKALLALAGLIVMGISAAGVLPLIGVAAGALLGFPWLRHRLHKSPLPTRRFRYRPFYLPGAFIIDLAEVFTMIRGSIRYRTLVL